MKKRQVVTKVELEASLRFLEDMVRDMVDDYQHSGYLGEANLEKTLAVACAAVSTAYSEVRRRNQNG
jgi:hypothetical protein